MSTYRSGDFYDPDARLLEHLLGAGPRICDDDAFAVEFAQALSPDELRVACERYPELVSRFQEIVVNFRRQGWAFDDRTMEALGALVAAERKQACVQAIEEVLGAPLSTCIPPAE